MFSRWMFARLRAAEKALDDGRIDEAWQRLSPADVRDQGKARKLLDDLASRLLARARLHAQAGRYREALGDLERIETAGRITPDARTLKKRAEEELRHRVGRHANENKAFQRAAEDIRQGRLDTGRLSLEKLEDPKARERLREELDLRAQRSDQLIERAQSALSRDDLLGACRLWEEACNQHGRSAQTDALAGELAPRYREALEGWLREGRLDRFCAALEATRALRLFAPELDEYERQSRLVRKAVDQLSTSNFHGLRETLLRLSTGCQGADWVRPVLDALDRIDAGKVELVASPLGLLGDSIHKTGTIGTAYASPPSHTVQRRPGGPPQHGTGAALNNGALLLLIDGSGSSLLTTRDVVRIGRAGADVEVPIPADIQSHHADVVRDGEDYFVIAHGPLRVNNQTVRRRLLRDGDRIALGPKVKMTFRKPSSRSETAVLQMSNRNRLAQDVDSVLLFRGTCMVGPQSNCHLRTREGDTRLVLFDRNGELFVRRTSRQGLPTGQALAVPERVTSEFGDVRVTVMQYDAQHGGGSA